MYVILLTSLLLLSLLILPTIIFLENRLAYYYRFEQRGLHTQRKSTLYGFYQSNKFLFSIVYRLFLSSSLILPLVFLFLVGNSFPSLIFVPINIIAIFLIFCFIFVFLIRRRFGIPDILPRILSAQLRKEAQSSYDHIRLQLGRGDKTVLELLEKRIEFLSSNTLNSPHLLNEEVDQVLEYMCSEQDDIGRAARILIEKGKSFS
jgi:hypothetical protein